MSEPDWENFAKAVLTDWPTGDLDGSVLFDLSLQYGMIQEVPGGYNSDHHIDAEGICPEEGDPWYEYTFRGEAGPGLYSIAEMDNRIEELEAQRKKTYEALLKVTRLHDEVEAKLAKAVEVADGFVGHDAGAEGATDAGEGFDLACALISDRLRALAQKDGE